ncbi:MAG: hypothetical protein KF838_06170 [Phycisphaeraceae bacterium]|nr:MAG: hypothetical protein KF838_06170 [Phycisphaeraceae bacterium]
MPVRRHPVASSTSHAPLSRMPLDLGLADRLKSTYACVRAHDLRLARTFYNKLFAAAPDLLAMFRSDPESQARKLMAALDAVVRNLEHPQENAAMLADLGRRHVRYCAKPEHYDLVIDLLIESMQEVLAEPDDAQPILEWRMALRLVAQQMIAASETPNPSP